jgi:hypothetical protein
MSFITQVGDLEAARDRWSALPITITGPLGDARRLILALLTENAELRCEVERLGGLLDRAWDALPEGHTVLRGEILTALGRPGCIWCGYPCREEGTAPCQMSMLYPNPSPSGEKGEDQADG